MICYKIDIFEEEKVSNHDVIRESGNGTYHERSHVSKKYRCYQKNTRRANYSGAAAKKTLIRMYLEHLVQ